MVSQVKCPNCDFEQAIHYSQTKVIYCPACGYKEVRGVVSMLPSPAQEIKEKA